MTNLYNSHGQHILNEHDGLLCLPAGRVVGRFIDRYGIFVDLFGRYFGEILNMNRFVYDHNSRYLNVIVTGVDCGGNLGPHLSPRDHGPMTLPPGFTDVNPGQLTAAS